MNEPDIVDALRRVGAKVESINGSTGVPDLLVGFRKQNYLLEVKHPIGEKGASKHQKVLNEEQELWHSSWPGFACVVRTPEEALWSIGAISEAPCVAPNAPIVKCIRCGEPVHTCERIEPFGSLSDYTCPRHQDGIELHGLGWACGEECERASRYGGDSA